MSEEPLTAELDSLSNLLERRELQWAFQTPTPSSAAKRRSVPSHGLAAELSPDDRASIRHKTRRGRWYIVKKTSQLLSTLGREYQRLKNFRDSQGTKAYLKALRPRPDPQLHTASFKACDLPRFIWLIDTDPTLLDCSDCFIALLGLRREELIGRKQSELAAPHLRVMWNSIMTYAVQHRAIEVVNAPSLRPGFVVDMIVMIAASSCSNQQTEAVESVYGSSTGQLATVYSLQYRPCSALVCRVELRPLPLAADPFRPDAVFPSLPANVPGMTLMVPMSPMPSMPSDYAASTSGSASAVKVEATNARDVSWTSTAPGGSFLASSFPVSLPQPPIPMPRDARPQGLALTFTSSAAGMPSVQLPTRNVASASNNATSAQQPYIPPSDQTREIAAAPQLSQAQLQGQWFADASRLPNPAVSQLPDVSRASHMLEVMANWARIAAQNNASDPSMTKNPMAPSMLPLAPNDFSKAEAPTWAWHSALSNVNPGYRAVTGSSLQFHPSEALNFTRSTPTPISSLESSPVSNHDHGAMSVSTPQSSSSGSTPAFSDVSDQRYVFGFADVPADSNALLSLDARASTTQAAWMGQRGYGTASRFS